MGGEFNFSESGVGYFYDEIGRMRNLEDRLEAMRAEAAKRRDQLPPGVSGDVHLVTPPGMAIPGSLADLQQSLHSGLHGTTGVWPQIHRLAASVDRLRAEDADRCQLRAQLEAQIEAQGRLHARDVTNLRSNMNMAHCDALSRIEKLEAESAERARIVAAFAEGAPRRDSTTPPPARQAWAPVKWALLGAALASLTSAALVALTGL